MKHWGPLWLPFKQALNPSVYIRSFASRLLEVLFFELSLKLAVACKEKQA